MRTPPGCLRSIREPASTDDFLLRGVLRWYDALPEGDGAKVATMWGRRCWVQRCLSSSGRWRVLVWRPGRREPVEMTCRLDVAAAEAGYAPITAAEMPF